MHGIKKAKKPTQQGFSMVELIVVVAMMFIVMIMAVIGTRTLLPNMRANSGVNQVIQLIRVARHKAISERRITTVSFKTVTINSVQVSEVQLQQVPPAWVGGPTVTLATVDLEGGAQLYVFPGLPDTPMGFGNSTPVSFSNPANPAAAIPALQFLSDGSFGTSVGVPINGTVFLGIPGTPSTARAVTILGSTGRVRPYHWDGARWLE
ncbi:MAG TPA: prepilin-type N-terminal cleavage/methylation domain-containing protein [Candidatus Dormibacteraeota bacterium]|nr:prepilin-type N-terminal cleavage/methylation domain-containing protein [Candidatus Dormibacteraeota bacterium]